MRAARFRSWHIASFRCAAEFGRYRGIADMAGVATGSSPSRMTRSGYTFVLPRRLRSGAKRILPCSASLGALFFSTRPSRPNWLRALTVRTGPAHANHRPEPDSGWAGCGDPHTSANGLASRLFCETTKRGCIGIAAQWWHRCRRGSSTRARWMPKTY